MSNENEIENSERALGNYLFYQKKLYPFDPAKVLFKAPREEKSGNSVHPFYLLNVDGRDVEADIFLCTPHLLAKWGYQYREQYKTHQLDMDLSDDPEAELFKQTMKAFDNHIKNTAYNNRAIWFKNGAKVTPDIIEYMYSSMVRKNEKVDKVTGQTMRYAPSIRLKIYERTVRGEKVLDAKAFDRSRGQETAECIPIQSIGRDTQVQAIFTLEKIWFSNKIFTPLKLKQVVRYNNSGSSCATGFDELVIPPSLN